MLTASQRAKLRGGDPCASDSMTVEEMVAWYELDPGLPPLTEDMATMARLEAEADWLEAKNG